MRLARCLILTLILMLAPVSLSAQAPQQDSGADSASIPVVVLSKLRSAAVQHEVIALAIKENKFHMVLPELKKIFDLNLPAEFEVYEVREVYGIVQKLSEKRQLQAGHAAIDLAFKYLNLDDSKLALYLMKGGLYRDAGQVREAIEAYEQARRFQRQMENRGSNREER